MVRRPAGRRTLDDVPLSKLAESLRLAAGGVAPASTTERDDLYRTVANEYGVHRPGEFGRARLDKAAAIAIEEGPGGEAALF
jgi:hypothetical protein